MDIHKYANQIRFNELDAKLKVLCEEIKKTYFNFFKKDEI